MTPGRIQVVAHDPGWIDAFELARSGLAAVLAPWMVAIEHIGSTSVPGLAAKPIIDIQVGIRSLVDGPAVIEAAESVGYEYRPEHEVEIPDRRFFRRNRDGVRTHHLHVVERSNLDWWDRHVAFRDWLLTHPADCDRYAALKQRLAAEYLDDRRGYTDAKTAFVQEIERRALGARTQVGRLQPGEWLGHPVDVVIDRPLGSVHPLHGFRYPVNYGYVPGHIAADGEGLDAYVLGPTSPLRAFRGEVIAVVLRRDDVEDKLVVGVAGTWDAESVTQAIAFQEQFFDSSVVIGSD
ncbi:MAG: GrpB family protein [Microbacteriaceae bacterium]